MEVNNTRVQLEGTLLSAPVSYQSVEEGTEVFLAKIKPDAPVRVGDAELAELFLNFGGTRPDFAEGERLTVTGTLEERQIVTRSGKMRRGGVVQLIVQDCKR